MKKLIIVITLAVTCIAAQAQNQAVSTNAEPVINQPTPPPILVSNAKEAFGAFIHYEFPSMNVEDSIKLAGAVMGILIGGSRYLRKIIPDRLQVNKLGLALAHIGGEVNPEIGKLAIASAEDALSRAAKAEVKIETVLPPKPVAVTVPPVV